jgi:polyisoprenoid-binding protein YceI
MRRTIIIGIVALLAALIGGGIWLYTWAFGETAAATAPISAIPLTLGSGSAGSDPRLFQIVPAQSEVRFTLAEVLRGQPNTVVGKSNQVAGQIAVDPSNLSATKMGVIQVNARTLATDSEQRNRTIRNRILTTNDYEYITFTPTEIRGLGGAAELGKPLTFQLAGNLTIRTVTRPALFDVTAHADSATRLSGTATTVINRSDYQLVIPSVPFVANVGEQVHLDIDFVAEAIPR